MSTLPIQLGLFTHEREPAEELEEEQFGYLVNYLSLKELEEDLYRERVLAWHTEGGEE